MSIAGGISVRGSTIRVLRPTGSRNADGSSKETWTELPNVKVNIVDGAAAQNQRIWGATTEARLLAFAHLDEDLQLDDAILPLSGDFAGERFRVIERRRETRRQRHLLLGLEPTTDTFLVDGVVV